MQNPEFNEYLADMGMYIDWKMVFDMYMMASEWKDGDDIIKPSDSADGSPPTGQDAAATARPDADSDGAERSESAAETGSTTSSNLITG